MMIYSDMLFTLKVSWNFDKVVWLVKTKDVKTSEGTGIWGSQKKIF